jgi:hypothetical protein
MLILPMVCPDLWLTNLGFHSNSWVWDILTIYSCNNPKYLMSFFKNKKGGRLLCYCDNIYKEPITFLGLACYRSFSAVEVLLTVPYKWMHTVFIKTMKGSLYRTGISLKNSKFFCEFKVCFIRLIVSTSLLVTVVKKDWKNNIYDVIFLTRVVF